MAQVTEVTDSNFQAEVIESDTATLVDFWAPWCGPCRIVGPVLEEIAAERDDLKIVKLNVDDNQQTAAAYQVLSIPTMILFRNGAEAKKIIGAYPKKQDPRAARARAGRIAIAASRAPITAIREEPIAASFSLRARAPARRGRRATFAPRSASTLAQYSAIRGFISSVTSGSPAWPRMFCARLSRSVCDMTSRTSVPGWPKSSSSERSE